MLSAFWGVSAARRNLFFYPKTVPKHRPKFRRKSTELVNKNLKRFWMNNKTIIEFGFRMMWRIMHISEDVLVPPRPSASVNNILLDQNSSHCFIKPPQIPRNRSFSPLSRIVSLGHSRLELPLACMAWRLAIFKNQISVENTFIAKVHTVPGWLQKRPAP